MFVYAPAPSQGVLKMFAMPKANLRPEPWVPATASTYQSYSWDLDAAFTAINDLVNNFQPGLLNVVEQQLAGGEGEPLSFQKDIFGPLGDRITIVTDYKKPLKEDSQRMLLAVALEDSKKFQATVNRLIQMSMAEPKKRDFQGTTIYDFTLPEMPNAAPNNPFKGTISLAIAKDYLFVATDPSLLELILRGGGAPLADSPAFQKVVKDVPSETSTLSYVNAEDQAKVSYEMIKSGAFEKALANQGGGDGNAKAMAGFFKLFNKDKLPEFSVFAKYIGEGGGYGVMDDDGIVFTNFGLKADKP
jgi:hypothetical protein